MDRDRRLVASGAGDRGTDVGGRNPTGDQTPAVEAVSDGEYDAGEGKLLSIKDLLKEAGKALGKTYFVDGRFLRNRVFVSGKFAPDRFIASLRRLTTAEPSSAIDGDASSHGKELNGSLEQLWSELADTDTSGSAAAELKRKLKNGPVNMTAGKMAASSQNVKNTCALRGIGPDAPVRVHRDMILYVYADGRFRLPGGGTTFNIEPFGLASQR